MFIEGYATGMLSIHKLNFTLSDMNEHAWQTVSPIPLAECGADILLCMRNAVLIQLIAGTGKRPIIIKTHSINAAISGIHPIPALLTGDSVYIVRDPRDVAISFAHHLGKPIDEVIGFMSNPKYMLQRDGGGAFQMIGTWSHNVKSWKHGLIVRYEDLLSDPYAWFPEILQTIGLRVNKPRLGKAIRLCEFKAVQKQEAKKRFVETSCHSGRFFSRGTSGHWRDILSQEQARKIEHDHREVMQQYGYLGTNLEQINRA